MKLHDKMPVQHLAEYLAKSECAKEFEYLSSKSTTLVSYVFGNKVSNLFKLWGEANQRKLPHHGEAIMRGRRRYGTSITSDPD